MHITETRLLIVITVVTAASTVFGLISLATPRWSTYFGLFCQDCSTLTAGLSIAACFLLVSAVPVLILMTTRILLRSLRLLPCLALFLSTIFTLAAYASYFDVYAGYSFKLMVVAHFLCYVASLLAAFWLGGSYAAVIVDLDIS